MPAKFVTCQLCGQGFGSASIAIHIPQCYDKALKRWQLDPRGPKPILPSRFAGGSSSSAPGRAAPGQPAPLRSTLHQQVHQGPTQGATTRGGAAAFNVPEQGGGSMMLSKCRKCGRGFSYDRVQYHESVCVGAASRKQFNSKKQRLSDFDHYELRAAAGGGGGGGGRGRGGAGAINNSRLITARGGGGGRGNWRQQHQEFQAAIRAARQYSKATATSRQPTVRGGPAPRQARQPFAANALRNPEMYRAKQAVPRGGAGGGGRSGPFPSMPQQPESAGRRPAPTNNSRAFGGGGDRFAPTPGSGGGGNYRILNTNQTSAGMMQAMGRM